jgi:2-polyprenyl-3-methyl-5-hydroxy-6-metoxy-1,4-benzoquinol methylase
MNKSKINTIKEWDHYWDTENLNKRTVYNLIAKFYRNIIIRPSLNFYICKYLKKGSLLLHAGAGSGEVDKNLHKYYRITALDISPKALLLYKKINGISSNTVRGDIFHLSLNQSYDCIYNLGVMEHYSEKEIHIILNQFKKVLKKNGYLILFWPPEYGLSVLFFKFLVFILKKVFFVKKVKLHPNEITRIKSPEHITKIMIRAGFKIKELNFGIRDMFTYVVVLAQKKE